MDRELMLKRPANAALIARAPAGAVLPRPDALTVGVHSKRELVKDVHRLAARGEIGAEYVIRKVPEGWRAEFVRVREPARFGWWWKAVAVLLALTAFLLALAWAAKAIIAGVAVLLTLFVAALTLVLLIVIVWAAFGGGGITVNQSVSIK